MSNCGKNYFLLPIFELQARVRFRKWHSRPLIHQVPFSLSFVFLSVSLSLPPSPLSLSITSSISYSLSYPLSLSLSLSHTQTRTHTRTHALPFCFVFKYKKIANMHYTFFDINWMNLSQKSDNFPSKVQKGVRQNGITYYKFREMVFIQSELGFSSYGLLKYLYYGILLVLYLCINSLYQSLCSLWYGKIFIWNTFYRNKWAIILPIPTLESNFTAITPLK